MAGLIPLPPNVLHTSHRLTHLQAHEMLSQFLEIADVDAAYRPNSTLSKYGPQSATSGPGTSSDLVLNHLKRILLGMEGKRVGGLPVFAEDDETPTRKRKYDGSANDGAPRAKRVQVQDMEWDDVVEGNEVGEAVAGDADGWQNKNDYDLAQEEEGVDGIDGGRQPGMDLEQPANAEEADGMAAVTIEGIDKKVGLGEQRSSKKSTKDKEARKQAKKERSKKSKKTTQQKG